MHCQVLGLFIKRQSGLPVEPVRSLLLQQGCGVQGDVSARVGSPRQVLLVGQEALEQFGLQPGNLRENLLLAGSVEEWESGQVLQIGDRALLRLTFLCEPCAFIETLQSGLTRRIRGRRGILAMVVRDGVVQVGDAVSVLSSRFPAIPTEARARFEAFVARIPAGRVVRTVDVVLALGEMNSFYRTIPLRMKKAPHLPVHRIVAIDGSLMPQHLPQQRELLLAEGVAIVQDRVLPDSYWQPEQFYDLTLEQGGKMNWRGSVDCDPLRPGVG